MTTEELKSEIARLKAERDAVVNGLENTSLSNYAIRRELWQERAELNWIIKQLQKELNK